MSDYKNLTASEISTRVGNGNFSAVEITQEALRLAGTEGKELNAFIAICTEKALARARAIDKMPLDERRRLPLAGVPVAIKDNISYSGYPTTCGSRILDGYVPPYDATIVTRLLRAGAVIIGKTNMDEFAMGSSSETSIYGPVKNPFDHTLTAGGSSGGSAAAVAQKIVPVALGSETGGSVRQPASFCGLLGLKPTYGAVSRYGLVAYCSSTDQISPFARNPHDLALICNAIFGHDRMDSTSATLEQPDYTTGLVTREKFRIGVIRECFTEGLDPQVEKVIRTAIGVLENLGHTLVDISLPTIRHCVAFHYIIAPAEASANLARFDGARYGLREGGNRPLDEMYAATRAAGFGDEVKRRIMLGTYALSAGYYDAYYVKACKVRELMKKEFEEAFNVADLLISPTAPTPAFKLGEKTQDPLAMYLSDIYTIPASQAGLPAVSVPFGVADNGCPVGVQLTAAPFEELSLLQAANILMERG